ncbi:hypothetical protein PYCC9005_005559 [Savitreella phatthalungensis]
MDLPGEVWLAVCSELDPHSLESLALSCRRMRLLIENENAWKAALVRQMNAPERFPALAKTWRQEYILRANLQRKYRRGRGRSLLFDCRVGPITHLHMLSPTSVMAGSMANGLVAIADTYSGKVSKALLYPSSMRLSSGDVTAMHLFRGGIIYGFRNGTVAFNHMVREVSKSFEAFTRAGWHDAPVTKLTMNDASDVNLASLADDGGIILWNFRDSSRHRGRHKVQGAIDVLWQGQRLLVLCSSGELWTIENDCCEIVERALDSSRAHSFAVDAGDVLTFTDRLIRRTGQLQIAKEVHLLHAAMAPEYPRGEELPGRGGCLAAYADDYCVTIIDARTLEAVATHTIEDGVISDLAISASSCCVGTSDGRLLVLDIFTGELLKQWSLLSQKHLALAEEQPGRFVVGNVLLGPSPSAGVFRIGSQVRAFDVDPLAERANGKRKGLSRRRHATTGAGMPLHDRRTTIQRDIEDDIYETMLREAENDRLETLAGGQLARDLTPDELVEYAQMLSAEFSHRQSNCDDDDLAEAVRRSLHDVEHATSAHVRTQEDDDFDYALAISLE